MAFRNKKMVRQSINVSVLKEKQSFVHEDSDGHVVVSIAEVTPEIDSNVDDFKLENLLRAGIDVKKINASVLSPVDVDSSLATALDSIEKNEK